MPTTEEKHRAVGKLRASHLTSARSHVTRSRCTTQPGPAWVSAQRLLLQRWFIYDLPGLKRDQSGRLRASTHVASGGGKGGVGRVEVSKYRWGLGGLDSLGEAPQAERLCQDICRFACPGCPAYPSRVELLKDQHCLEAKRCPEQVSQETSTG